MELINKIRKFFRKIKYSFSKDACYDLMLEQGIAKDSICNGINGGDKYTNYLHYDCIDCPYFRMMEED